MSKSTLCAGSLNAIIVPIVLMGKLRLRVTKGPRMMEPGFDPERQVSELFLV